MVGAIGVEYLDARMVRSNAIRMSGEVNTVARNDLYTMLNGELKATSNDLKAFEEKRLTRAAVTETSGIRLVKVKEAKLMVDCGGSCGSEGEGTQGREKGYGQYQNNQSPVWFQHAKSHKLANTTMEDRVPISYQSRSWHDLKPAPCTWAGKSLDAKKRYGNPRYLNLTGIREPRIWIQGSVACFIAFFFYCIQQLYDS
eukprot:scaffold4183_cov137-Cylindrotheca_fusiformis.AAC.2